MSLPPPFSQALIAESDVPRLDVWLHEQFPDHSRSGLQRLIREGHVQLNGLPSTPNNPVRMGDKVDIAFRAPLPMNLEAEAIPLDILKEDRHLLVLNKPPGMVVHPGAGHFQHTLVHALLHHCHGQLSGIGGVERPGIVHRLDKDTSGCLVVAKTDEVHRKLTEAFQSRAVEKIYLALVQGRPRFLSGKIDQLIGRHPVHRQKMAITPKGKQALTEWRVLQNAGENTLLECRIHSGRTHQIRVHLAFIGHPVVGDAIYGKSREAGGRQLLHAWKLSFAHPVTGRSIACEAPMPEDMKEVLDKAAISTKKALR